MPEPLSDEDTLRALGHWDISVLPTRDGQRYRAHCECGWISMGYARRAEAVQGALHHRRKMLQEHRASGLPLSAKVLVIPEEEKVTTRVDQKMLRDPFTP